MRNTLKATTRIMLLLLAAIGLLALHGIRSGPESVTKSLR